MGRECLSVIGYRFIEKHRSGFGPVRMVKLKGFLGQVDISYTFKYLNAKKSLRHPIIIGLGENIRSATLCRL